jgi:hypothetical protein
MAGFSNAESPEEFKHRLNSLTEKLNSACFKTKGRKRLNSHISNFEELTCLPNMI